MKREHWFVFAALVFIGILLTAQAPKPGVGAPVVGVGTPVGVIFTRIATTTAANTTDEVFLLSAGVGSAQLSPGVLHPGRMIRIMQRGTISDTGNPTFRYRIYMNSEAVVDTGAVALPGIPTNGAYTLNAIIICRTSGVAGTVQSAGELIYQTSQGIATIAANWGDATTHNVNTMVPISLNSSVQWGAASPLNSMSVSVGSVEILN